MIRKLLFTATFAMLFLNGVMSQTCTPNPVYASEPPGLWPDSVTNLPIAGTLSNYSTVIDLKCVVDTVVGSYTIKVHATKIYSVSGMPPGFNYFPSYGTSTDGWVNPGTAPNLTSAAGCVLVDAPQSAVQTALTSPNANGVYPLIITVDMKISTYILGMWSAPIWMSSDGTFASQMPVVDRYRIKVEQGATTIEEFNDNGLNVEQNFPNPFSKHTNFTFYNKAQEKVNFKVFNVIGKEVYAESIDAQAGTNHYAFNAKKIAAGIYICTFDNGTEKITKRIIVDK